MKKKTKVKIIFTIFATIVGFVSAFLISTFLYRILEGLPITASDFLPHVIIASIIENQKHGLIFVTMLLILMLTVVLISISIKDRNIFASELDKITDKISTPKKIGQYQHGSARWLLKSQCPTSFYQYKLDKSNSLFSFLIVKGENEIKLINEISQKISEDINLSENKVEDVLEETITTKPLIPLNIS